MNTKAIRNLRSILSASAVGSLNVTAHAIPTKKTVRRDRVQARDLNVYEYDFRAGEEVGIVVDGDGNTDLDLFVIDACGNVLALDIDITDYCVATLSPRRNGAFYVAVENLGSVDNEFEMTVDRAPSPGGPAHYTLLDAQSDRLPIEHVDRVFPYDMDVYQVTFEAGRAVSVTVDGRGTTDLDLYVVDKAGKMAARDIRESGTCSALFAPEQTGTFFLGVDNLGNDFNQYTLRIS